MSTTDDRDEMLLALVLAGTPDRVIDAVVQPSDEDRVGLERHRTALASTALALKPVAPPTVEARAHFAARIAGSKSPRERLARRALVVLDMIGDYLTPGRPLHVPRAKAIVPALRERLDRAREAGEPVLYLCDRHAPDDPELHTWPAHAVEGTDGADVITELAPRPGEPVLGHRTYSAFFETELERTLRSLSVDTLVLTGCATEVGLLATATDALMRGFRVEVPVDCQAGTSEVAEQVALGVLHVMRPVEPFAAR